MGKLAQLLDTATKWRTRRKEKHNRAVYAIDSFAGDIDKFFTKYLLQEHPTDIRLIFKNIAVVRVDLIELRVRSLKIATMVKDIGDKDLSTLLNEVSNNLEKFRKVLSSSTINNEVVVNCVDNLFDSRNKFLEARSVVKYK